MNTSQDWLKVLNYRQNRKLENLRRFALSHDTVTSATIREGSLVVTMIGIPGEVETVKFNSLGQLRDHLGY